MSLMSAMRGCKTPRSTLRPNPIKFLTVKWSDARRLTRKGVKQENDIASVQTHVTQVDVHHYHWEVYHTTSRAPRGDGRR